jgi:hypothetical protein
MRRFTLLRLFLVLAVGNSLVTLGRAQDPADVLKHFRLIPRLSTLHTTGIEGPDIHYRLMGKYDFRHGRDWPIQASFENAEIWGSQISDLPTPAIVIDVDELLNLENLRGEALPVAAPFDVYQFKGDTPDGSSVNLFAAVLGPWMVVRGATEPPPIIDFGTHRFHWVARSRPFADLNDDGVVDTADFVVLRHAESRGTGIGSEEDGTEGVSFADWAQQFGETLPDFGSMDAALSSALAGASAAAVPEPASASLVLWGTMLFASFRRIKVSRCFA